MQAFQSPIFSNKVQVVQQSTEGFFVPLHDHNRALIGSAAEAVRVESNSDDCAFFAEGGGIVLQLDLPDSNGCTTFDRARAAFVNSRYAFEQLGLDATSDVDSVPFSIHGSKVSIRFNPSSAIVCAEQRRLALAQDSDPELVCSVGIPDQLRSIAGMLEDAAVSLRAISNGEPDFVALCSPSAGASATGNAIRQVEARVAALTAHMQRAALHADLEEMEVVDHFEWSA